MKVLLVDALSTGGDHAAWNAAIIHALTCLESISLDVLLAESQLAHPYFKTLIRHPTVQVSSIPPTPHGDVNPSKRETLWQLWSGYRLLFQKLRTATPGIVVVLAADNTVTPVVLNVIAAHRLIAPNRTFVFLHSNLEQLERAPWKRRLWQICLWMSDTTAVVLAPFLEPAVDRMMPGIRTRVLPNPTYAHLDDMRPVADQDRFSEADFIFVGRHAYEALATGFLAAFLECCVRCVSQAGRLTVALPEGIDIVSRDPRVALYFYPSQTNAREYLNCIAQSRFAVVSDKRATEFKTSGIIADFLTVGTPFIAPNLGVWSWQSAVENAELLYDRVDDLQEVLRKALTMSETEYRALRAATKRCGRMYSIEATANGLADILGIQHAASVR